MINSLLRFPLPACMAAFCLLALPAPTEAADAFADARNQMVALEVVGAGVKNERVIEAVRNTPRHEFVLFKDRPMAYYDMALPIGNGQTISPPFIVAYMTEQLDPQPSDKVLEIGTGSGYQAAVLSPLVAEVYSIEIVEPLGRRAAQTLKRLGYRNVFTKVGDGYQGWAEHAPFDKIIVTCSPESVPQPLIDQLAEGGRLIVPLGQRFQQVFYLFRKENGKLVSEALRPTLFVPMTGQAEALREVQPDAANPQLQNGGFEQFSLENNRLVPEHWHYARQVDVVEDKLCPEGTHYVLFENRAPGRASQILQGFPVDGQQVDAIEISLHVKGQEIRLGQNPTQLPMLVVLFYDERQEMVGQRTIGPWRGTFPWQPERELFEVPPRAKTGIMRIGLLGAVGQLGVDNIQINPALLPKR